MGKVVQLTPSMAVKIDDYGEATGAQVVTNRIAIYDRSGSMSWALSKVTADLLEWVKTVPVGDTVTLGWFSGKNQFRWLVKGYRVTDPSGDHAIIAQALERNNHVIGATCFEEIAKDLAQVMDELNPITPSFSLVWFTDGCPVPDTEEQELETIQALAKVAHRIDSALFVGYGDYYNRAYLARMAGTVRGACVHAGTTYAWRHHLWAWSANQAFLKARLVNLKAPGNRIATYYAVDEQLLPLADDGYVRLPSVSTTVYTLLSQTGTVRPSDDERDVRAAYAAALRLSQLGFVDQALLVAGNFLGDVRIVRLLGNAYTNTEIGAAERELAQCVDLISFRHQEGKQLGCVPDENAFCVFDALNLLAHDQDAYFYPNHPAFEYERIGVRTFVEGKRFEPDSNAKCPFSRLTMHDSRLNVSVSTKIEGHVILGEDGAAHGLAARFPSYVHRTYTIIKDGRLHTQKLYASMSRATWEVLSKHEVVVDSWEYGAVFEVDLAALPVMNRAGGNITAEYLAKLELSKLDLMGYLKALRSFRTEPEPKAEGLPQDIVDYLAEVGISDKGYAPKTTRATATDYYEATTFEIKVEGLSSFPSVSEVLARIAAGKVQTAAGEMVLGGIEEYERIVRQYTPEQVNGVLADLIAFHERTLFERRTAIQHIKFAALAGNRWFADLDRRNPVLTVNGYEVRFVIGKTEIGF